MIFHNFWLYDIFQEYKQNSNFSLRQFADMLGISPSLLSQIFTGKRKITKTQLQKILTILPLEENERENIQDKYELSDKKNNHLKMRLKKHFLEVQSFNPIDLGTEDYQEAMKPIPMAIFQFVRVQPKNFDKTEEQKKWLNDNLNYSSQRIDFAIEKLTSLGLIKEYKGKLQTLCDFYRPKETILNSDRLIENYNYLCTQSAENFLPDYNSKEEIATALHKDSKGFDVISWDYLFLTKKEALQLKEDLNQFHKSVLSLSKDCTEGDLNYSFMGSQLFKF